MARTGSIIRRTMNNIFRVNPEMQPDPREPDSDKEAHGMLKALDMSNPSPQHTHPLSLDDQGAFAWYAEQMKRELNRRARYDVYNEMDKDSPELSSALDIYADNSTQAEFDGKERVVKIDSDDKQVKGILDTFIEDVCLNQHVWGIARNLAKFGEDFTELVVDKNLNPRRLKALDGRYMMRNENQYGTLMPKAFLQRSTKDDKIIAEFQRWQIIHFRMQKERTDKYGASILESAVKVYRQLSFMEDSMVIARLTRAQQRYAHLVDVEGMTADDAEAHIEKVKTRMRKRKTINPRTGRQDLNYNPLAAEEDIFLGTREKSRADVKVLQGDTNLSNIKDVYYFQNKLFSATKVPKAYLGLESDVGAKGTVTEQEIQFARTVKRIQNAIISGLEEMFHYVLAINGIPKEKAKFTVVLPPISMIDELRKWQSRLVKMQVAQLYAQVFHVNAEYLMRTFLGMTEEEVEEVLKNQDEMYDLQKQAVELGLKNAEKANQQGGNPNGMGNNNTGGAGNKVGGKSATDTKHNTNNSMNRKTQKQAGTRPASQQTNSNANKKAEALKLLTTDLVESPEELLEAVKHLLSEE